MKISNSYMFNIALVVLFLFNFVVCDVIRLGKCPIVKMQRGFRNFLFTGDWFEIARNPILLLSNTKCNKVNLKQNGNKYNLKSGSIFKNFNKEINFDAYAYSPDTEEPAKMTIEYPLTLLRTNITLPYWVLYTDYEHAVIWSCVEYLKILHLEYFWILARKPYISEEKLRDLTDILTLSNIDSTYIVRTEQMGCV